MQSVDAVLEQAAADLDAIGARWAVIGGLAVASLAGRHQDLTDLGYLISAATDADLDEARASASLIEERGFNRGQRLSEDLAAIIGQARK